MGGILHLRAGGARENVLDLAPGRENTCTERCMRALTNTGSVSPRMPVGLGTSLASHSRDSHGYRAKGNMSALDSHYN